MFNQMKGKILCTRYHQKGHESETPSNYYHRKLQMIQEVFVQTESETIMEIMNSAPKYWSVTIDTSRINTLSNLQYHIKYHEEALIQNPDTQTHKLERHIKALEERSSEPKAEALFAKNKLFRRKLVGAHALFSDYQFSKNNKIVSKGKTPGQKGAQPCQHCGSLNHWDFDHPFNGKDDRRAKAFLSSLDSKALKVYVTYKNCYLEDSEPEEKEPADIIKEGTSPQGFWEDEDFPPSLA